MSFLTFASYFREPRHAFLATAGRFFATVKTEFYDRRIWPTRDRPIRDVSAWIEDCYNRRRRHSSIGHVTPVDFEMHYSSQAAEIQLAAQPLSTQAVEARPNHPTTLPLTAIGASATGT